MNKIIKNIPTFLFLYLGLLGLLFFGIYILNQWVEESFMMTLMIGIYGGICIYGFCEAFLQIPFMPVLVVMALLFIFSFFIIKTDKFVVRLRKISFKFLITVIVLDICVLLLIPLFNQGQSSSMADKLMKKHLFNIEMPVTLTDVHNDLNANNYIVSGLDDYTCVTTPDDVYCVEESSNIDSSNEYFYGDRRMHLVSQNNLDFNMEAFDNNVELAVIFDDFLYIQSISAMVLIDKKTGKMYYSDWVLDEEKTWYENFDLNDAIVKKNRAIAEGIKEYFKGYLD